MSHVLGIGSEIVECLRIAQMIERHGELFINRVYTAYEINYCHNRKQSTQHFAGRWAAKEAIFKAIGSRWRKGIRWRDLEIRNHPDGHISATFLGPAVEIIERVGVEDFMISISHCRSYATAYVLAMGHSGALLRSGTGQ